MSQVNSRRILSDRIENAERPYGGPGVPFPYDAVAATPPCDPNCLLHVLGELIARVEETNKRLAERLTHVLKPFPTGNVACTQSPPSSEMRLSLRDLHAAIGRLNDTIDAIDL
jgi:hypothetical protein